MLKYKIIKKISIQKNYQGKKNNKKNKDQIGRKKTKG
jgi:hypothetical protein